MKILFFASYPTLTIGYARIGNILSNFLAESGHEVYYLGISNFDNLSSDRYIHSKIILIDALVEEKKKGSDEIYGVNVICDIIEEIKPDLLFLYNDIIVISRIFNNIIERKIVKDFKTIVYLDLVYQYEKINLVQYIDVNSDHIFVFSDCWKKNLILMGVDENKIGILPHGFDSDKFYPIDKLISRQKFSFNDNDFIILNTNRNSYRKAIDITIGAFIKFLKIKNMDPTIKLFLNMNLENGNLQSGYDIFNLIKIFCIKYGVDYDTVILNHIYRSPSVIPISDEMLNYLYNACDIGINTCVGEGFGLCNLEHGAIGKPQIISNVGGLSDIFNEEYAILVNPVTELYLTNHYEYHGGYIQICSLDDFVDGLIKYYDNRDIAFCHGLKSEEFLVKKYNWTNILKILSDKISSI